MKFRARYAAVAVLLIAGCALLLPFAASARANSGGIALWSESVAGEFPDGIRFNLRLTSEADIQEIAARLRIGQRTFGEYEYLDVEQPEADGSVSDRKSVV